MKRAILIAGAVLLLLTGCAAQESPDTTTDTVQIVESQPGIYVPESNIEKQTGGAVRQYALDNNIYSQISMMGERLVVAGGTEHTIVKLYSGDRSVETASVQIPGALDAIGFMTYYNGGAYYLESARQFVFLDMQMQEVARIELPDGISGRPVLSNDGAQIFYSTNQQIYAIDVARKITRLVKTHECKSMTLVNSLMNGSVLFCRTEYEDGRVSLLYIDTQTGQALYDYDQIKELHSYEDLFFGRLIDGGVEQLFFGKGQESISQINLQGGNYVPALELNSVIRYEASADGELQLQLLDLNEGKLTSQISLRDSGELLGFAVNRWKNCLWLLTKDGHGKQSLLRWNIKSSPIEDETIYTGPLFTSTNPDEAGLNECLTRAKAIGKTHDVQIRLWQNAVKYPGDYVLEPEHQTTLIQQCLDQVEEVLKEFPKKFIKDSISNQIRICIVRSIDGEAKAVHYWNGSSAYIVLSIGCDVRNGFVKGLSYVVDSHVLGNTSKYDYWNEANPEGFSYADRATHSKSYLKGNRRAFVDEISMTSVVEDRSAIFYEAMQPDNQDMFRSEAMQNKLIRLCNAVRSAWKLRKSTEIFPWEQYLDKPIAAKK